MKFKITVTLLLITTALYAQEEELLEYDAYSEDYSYDLVADRINCVEQEVPLHFNERVFAFVNYFIVIPRSDSDSNTPSISSSFAADNSARRSSFLDSGTVIK